MPWSTPGDVRDAWIGEGLPDDDGLIGTWLGKAEREMRFRVPDLAERVEADSSGELRATAVDVAVSMVMRVLRNPEGIRQRNITTGPYTGSETYGGDVPGGLALTDDELAKLRGVRSRGAFTVDLIPPSSPFSPAYPHGWWSSW